MRTQTAWPAVRSFGPAAKNGMGPKVALHPCVARPDLYPDEVPPLGAGSIHAHAALCLHGFVTSRLQDQNAGEPFAVEYDVPLYRAPKDYVVPDVYAYARVRQPRGTASTYHLKHDGAPDLVLEIISISTWDKDVSLGSHTLWDKKDFYRDIGVAEYWIYDPESLRQDKACLFEGFRWVDGVYRRVKPDTGGRWPSAVLQTRWIMGPPYILPNGRRFPLLRLLDPVTGRWYLTGEERKASIAEKDEALTEQAALLTQYTQRFGPLDTDALPPRA